MALESQLQSWWGSQPPGQGRLPLRLRGKRLLCGRCPFRPSPESLGVCCVRAGPQEPWLRWPLAWNEEWSKGRLWDVLCFRVALITRMTLCSVPAWQPRGVADTWGTAAGSVGALAVRGSQLAVTKSCCLFLSGMEILKHASACCVEGMKVFSGMPPT